MTKAIGTKYPEYACYPKGWKAIFCRRLDREGRKEDALDYRHVIKVETNCTDEESWVRLCDVFVPIKKREPEKSTTKPEVASSDEVQELQALIGVEIATEQEQLSIYDEALWAYRNYGIRTKMTRVAPSAGAYQMLRMAARDHMAFMKLFAELEKRQTKTEGKDWAKDDDEELADVLEANLLTIRATAARERAGLCPTCADRAGREFAVPPGADSAV
jgi:hypothetical protein